MRLFFGPSSSPGVSFLVTGSHGKERSQSCFVRQSFGADETDKTGTPVHGQGCEIRLHPMGSRV